MTAKLAIGWINRGDSASLSASSAVSSLPVINLQSTDVRALWRATASPAWIVADLGASMQIGAVILLRSNAVATDTVRVRLSTSDVTGAAGDAYDSGSHATGTDPIYKIVAQFLPSPATGRYLRVDLTQAAIPEAGRLFAGPIWYPSRTLSYGWGQTWRDPSRLTESIGQAIFADIRTRQRGIHFQLRGLTNAEANADLTEINRLCGSSSDVLICRDTGASNIGQATIWGLLSQTIPYPETEKDLVEAEFDIYERL